jgi:gluconolactonase
MKLGALFAAGMCAFSVGVAGQGRGGTPPPPAVDTVAPDIPGVVAGGAKVQVLKEGFNGTEGPIAMPDGSVIFSETTANRTIRIDKDGNFSTFLENTAGANGLSFDSEGRLFATHVPWGGTKISIIYPEAAKKVLADNYDGKPFGRTNDLAAARNGGVYFTDSANPTPAPPEGLPLPAAFYYLPPRATKAIQILNDVALPNGVILSRDEKTLDLNTTTGEYLIAFDVQPDGSLKNRRNFAKYEGVTKNAAWVRISDAVQMIAQDFKDRAK